MKLPHRSQFQPREEEEICLTSLPLSLAPSISLPPPHAPFPIPIPTAPPEERSPDPAARTPSVLPVGLWCRGVGFGAPAAPTVALVAVAADAVEEGRSVPQASQARKRVGLIQVQISQVHSSGLKGSERSIRGTGDEEAVRSMGDDAWAAGWVVVVREGLWEVRGRFREGFWVGVGWLCGYLVWLGCVEEGSWWW